MSPQLFNIFIDDLSNILNNAEIGCNLNSVCFNHLQYAADAAILPLSPVGLQQLSHICETFVKEYMICNVKKTFCMCIRSKSTKNLRIPDVFLNGKSPKWVPDHKYHGVLLHEFFKSLQ